jgi:septum formation protein
MELILASNSPRRAELLKQIGLDFKIIPSLYSEEIQLLGDPSLLVKEHALNKAKQVARTASSGLVIGADTVVFLEGQMMGKPSGTDEAVKMLSDLSGKVHQVFTGVALVEVSTWKLKVDCEMTEVKFRFLNGNEIEAYVTTKEPFDKAGAYGIQGKGAVLVEGIKGCYFNVVGLPIVKLVTMLQEFGVSVW